MARMNRRKNEFGIEKIGVKREKRVTGKRIRVWNRLGRLEQDKLKNGKYAKE
jgi:hypothetical protein